MENPQVSFKNLKFPEISGFFIAMDYFGLIWGNVSFFFKSLQFTLLTRTFILVRIAFSSMISIAFSFRY